MNGQYLSNTNESATVSIFQKNLELNQDMLVHLLVPPHGSVIHFSILIHVFTICTTFSFVFDICSVDTPHVLYTITEYLYCYFLIFLHL